MVYEKTWIMYNLSFLEIINIWFLSLVTMISGINTMLTIMNFLGVWIFFLLSSLFIFLFAFLCKNRTYAAFDKNPISVWGLHILLS